HQDLVALRALDPLADSARDRRQASFDQCLAEQLDPVLHSGTGAVGHGDEMDGLGGQWTAPRRRRSHEPNIVRYQIQYVAIGCGLWFDPTYGTFIGQRGDDAVSPSAHSRSAGVPWRPGAGRDPGRDPGRPAAAGHPAGGARALRDARGLQDPDPRGAQTAAV